MASQGSCHFPKAWVVPLQGKGPNDSTGREVTLLIEKLRHEGT